MSLYCSLSESVISFHLPPISLPSSPKVASGFSAFTLSRTVLENIMNADMGFFGAFLSLTFLAFLAGASLLLLAGLSALGLRFLALGAEPPPSPSEPPDMSSLAMSLPSSESSSDGSPSSSSSLPIWKSSSSSLPCAQPAAQPCRRAHGRSSQARHGGLKAEPSREAHLVQHVRVEGHTRGAARALLRLGQVVDAQVLGLRPLEQIRPLDLLDVAELVLLVVLGADHKVERFGHRQGVLPLALKLHDVDLLVRDQQRRLDDVEEGALQWVQVPQVGLVGALDGQAERVGGAEVAGP
mmetsp:Transcript_39575/g.101170  ORF Transcript_39575/g.101170 Transcript_39575/m.101170 type:complete len:296 (-) Transcript_39575:1216-2103(-)